MSDFKVLREATAGAWQAAVVPNGQLKLLLSAYDALVEQLTVPIVSPDVPSPEPAAKTELTAEELTSIRCYEGGLIHRLLDEHAALKVRNRHLEREHLHPCGADEATLADAKARIVGLNRSLDVERESGRHAIRQIDEGLERIKSLTARIAELESALALATDAVAAEARAKVEGLTCTEAERFALDEAKDLDTADIDSIRNVHRDFGDALLELMRCRLVARREAAKAKGDGQ